MKSAEEHYYSALTVDMLRQYLVLTELDPTYWLRKNFPTLAAYL